SPNSTEPETVVVVVNGDHVHEADEFFSVSLSNAQHAHIADGSARGLILNDEPYPLLAIGDATVTEGHTGTTTLVFPVTLTTASSFEVTADFSTADGSA